MARLLPLILLLVAVALFLVARRNAGPRSDRVYRPRASPFGRGSAAESGDGLWVVRRGELDGVRDAYSSAALDPAGRLFRCGRCQAWDHEGSVRALDLENDGRCALCGGMDLREVTVV